VAAEAGARATTTSSLHAFNRFEIKYLVHRTRLGPLRDGLQAALDPDGYSGTGGYPVESVYYDTRGLQFYWEKIEGLRFRRKLRLRRYGGDGTPADDAGPVFVEVKQRVNRVTQKRRLCLPYGDALRLCAGQGFRRAEPLSSREQAFVDEVTSLVGNLRLLPVVTTAYHREAYLGRGADLGLRVTVDHRLRGRDRDFRLASGSSDRFTLPPDLAVLEIKANERVSTWVTDLAARLDLQVVRISKYCQSVEAFRLAPRCVMHRADEVEELMEGCVAP
jgi:SPX domain protein involved in polyphosphate accumulation